jgi:D-amino peptidase
VTGDDKCCEQAKRLKAVRTVAVKRAIGRNVATSLSPEVARERIRRAAFETVRGARELLVFKPAPPFDLEVDMVNTACIELSLLAPGTERTAPRTVRYQAEDVQKMMRVLLAWMYLARHAAPEHKVD